MDPSEGKEELKLFGWMNFSRADSKKSSSKCEVLRLSTVIGRDQSLDLRIHDPRISRRQCELIITGSETEEYTATIKNLTSRKTTVANGHALEVDETVVLNDSVDLRLANYIAYWTPNLTIFGSPTLGLKSKLKFDLGDNKQELDKENQYVDAGNKETPIQASPGHEDKKVRPGPSRRAKESETSKSPRQEDPLSPPKEDRSLLESDMKECSIRLERVSVTPHVKTPKVQLEALSVEQISKATALGKRTIKVNDEPEMLPKLRRGKQVASDQEKVEKPKATRRGKPTARNTVIETKNDADNEVIHEPKPRRVKQPIEPTSDTDDADKPKVTRRGKTVAKPVKSQASNDTEKPRRGQPAVRDIEEADKPKATRRDKAAAKDVEIEPTNHSDMDQTEKAKPKSRRGQPVVSDTDDADKPKATRRGKTVAKTVESRPTKDTEKPIRGQPAVRDTEEADKPKATRRGKAAAKAVEIESDYSTEKAKPKSRRGQPVVSDTEDADKPKATRRGKAAAKAVEIEETEETENSKPKSRRGRPAVSETNDDADKPKATRRGKAATKTAKIERSNDAGTHETEKPKPRRGRQAIEPTADTKEAGKPKTMRGDKTAVKVELESKTTGLKTKKTETPKVRRGGNEKLEQSSPISDVPAKRARREEATTEVKSGRVTRGRKY
ncbi:cylicin-2 [Folsomia candida]|uniref:FHA domain-containing protein n=1 Tax=Folsomia candida TaxID=158441 RepID=A0A226EMD9_FOLCA|nr:cylicin-2 [Folsomia candida]OXA57726.1 hypothetical protein Fcan01_08236 [Folsomia candida]